MIAKGLAAINTRSIDLFLNHQQGFSAFKDNKTSGLNNIKKIFANFDNSVECIFVSGVVETDDEVLSLVENVVRLVDLECHLLSEKCFVWANRMARIIQNQGLFWVR